EPCARGGKQCTEQQVARDAPDLAIRPDQESGRDQRCEPTGHQGRDLVAHRCAAVTELRGEHLHQEGCGDAVASGVADQPDPEERDGNTNGATGLHEPEVWEREYRREDRSDEKDGATTNLV